MQTAVPARANLDNIAGRLTGQLSELLSEVLALSITCHQRRKAPSQTSGAVDYEHLLDEALQELALTCPLGGTLAQDMSYWRIYALGPSISCGKPTIRACI